MFSLQIESTLKSGIGQHLPLLQHLVSLAVVESVRTLGMGYENIDLRLKWPNDIYAGAQYKVGGVVVFTSILRDCMHKCSALCSPIPMGFTFPFEVWKSPFYSLELV